MIRWMHCIAAILATSLMFAMLLSAAPAAALTQSGLSVLRGVDAQPMTESEMKAVSGQLNALDIAAALKALAAKEGAYPKLQAATLKLATYFTTSATAINAKFQQLGILTPCKSCAP